MSNKLTVVAVIVVALAVLFDVTLVMDFGSSRNVELPDPAVELQYTDCYRQKDQAMHDVAFGTIDNPDVQREYISANRARIENECRKLYPQQLRNAEEQSEFNLIDVQPRFW